MILICGFSPDFFKRKTLTHHYPLRVVCLFYHCPSPRGVPLFAKWRHGSLASGKVASALCFITPSIPVPFWVQMLSQAPGSERMFWRREWKRAPSLLGGLQGFPVLGFSFFSHFPFISWHNEACLSQCYAMDFYENSLSVSHTIFFNAVYSPVNSLCKIWQKSIFTTL